MAISESAILKSELRWAAVVAGIVAIILGAILFAALSMHINPPSNREYVDPKTLHLSAEFTEENLGTRVDPNGRVVARMITTQFQFIPNCLLLPADTDVTLRFTSPDVIHGLLVTGTNVNTMVVPGYVAQVHTRFTKTGDLLMPCHEYCGLGHSQMVATVKVWNGSSSSDRRHPPHLGGEGSQDLGGGAARSSNAASSSGRLSAMQWPASISSGTTPSRSATTRRMNGAGKNRSSVPSTNLVGTAGRESSGSGLL